MALWFAQADGPLTPSRVGKRCVQLSSLGAPPSVIADASSAAGYTPRHAGSTQRTAASTTVNQETDTVYMPCGRRRVQTPNTTPATSLMPERLGERSVYTHSPWEAQGKKIIQVPPKVEKERHVTPRKAAPPPFGTFTADCVDVAPHRPQKRIIDTPVAYESVGEQTYAKKRSRTPPAGVADRCPTEGFCVLYSVNPTEGGNVQHMTMVNSAKNGKGYKFCEKNFVNQREEAEAKHERIETHKRQSQQVRLAVVRPDPHPVGIRRCTTPTTSAKLVTPYATEMPSGKNCDVGLSIARIRQQRLTAPSRTTRN